MATEKYRHVADLLNETTLAVTSSTEKWLNFLEQAAHFYKYNFNEVLLIHAQRPTATACAEINLWNKLGRWVNRGSKGIALINDNNPAKPIRHVFDVADTHHLHNRPFQLWQYKVEHHDAVMDSLENAYGEHRREEQDFTWNIANIVDNVLEENKVAYLDFLVSRRQNSPLENLDLLELDELFTTTAALSINFIVSQRCGYQAMHYFDTQDLDVIARYFNTPASAIALGAAVSDISEMLLRDIESTVKDYEKEKRILAQKAAVGQNKGKDKTHTNERIGGNEPTVHPERRLSDTHTDDKQYSGTLFGALRNAAAELSKNREAAGLPRSAARPEFLQQPERPRPASEKPVGADSGAVVDNRAAPGQRTEQPSMGAARPKPAGQGAGNSDGRVGVLLSNQVHHYSEETSEDGKHPRFSNPEEINQILKNETAPHIAVSHEEVDAFFRAVPEREKQVEFLQRIMNEEYTGFYLHGDPNTGIPGGYKIYHEGILLYKGSHDPSVATEKQMISWEKVADIVNGLVHTGTWLDKKSDFPSENEQISMLGEVEHTSPFLVPQAEIDKLLIEVSPNWNGKLDIYEANRSMGTGKEFTKFVKKTYQYYDVFVDEVRFNADPKNGVTVVYQDNRITLSWAKVAKRIDELISVNRYLTIAEIGDLGNRITDRAHDDELEPDIAASISQPATAEPETQPQDAYTATEATEPYEFKLNVGDSFFIGREKFEIFGFNETEITVQNPDFPLFTETHSRADFFSKVHGSLLNKGNIPPRDISPVDLYRDWLQPMATAMRELPVYSYIREEDVDPDTAQSELATFIEEKIAENENQYAHFAQSYNKLPKFKEWFVFDVYDVLYQDYHGIEWQDQIALNADKADTPQWASSNKKEDLEKAGLNAQPTAPSAGLPAEKEKIRVGKKVFFNNKPYRIMKIDAEKQEATLLATDPNNIYSRNVLASFDILLEQIAFTEQINSMDPPPVEVDITVPLHGKFYKVKEVIEGKGQVLLVDSDGGEIKKPIAEVQYTLKLIALQDEERAVEPPAAVQATVEPANLPSPQKQKQERLNYTITNESLGHGGAKTKYSKNIAAIRLLKELEENGRNATPEDQETLAQYVGWGGIPQAFDEAASGWESEYAELKALLTEDEYNSARETTLNAHYTSPTVIKAMYDALHKMGFKNGNILEPSMGIGNFFGKLPEEMKGSKLFGVELDSVTGRIAKQLYQKANIAVQGYEDTDLPDSFFDLAIGNVPFGSYQVADPKFKNSGFYIHDYFFAKTLDKVRPGGVIAFVTSKGTLDKANSKVRRYIAQRAELIGAIRLPDTAFRANAGTEVTSDIIFLKKRDRMVDVEPDWLETAEIQDGITVNKYFADNPHMIMGKMVKKRGLYREDETACEALEGVELADQLAEAVTHLQAEYTEPELDDELDEDAVDTSLNADPNVRNYSYTLVDGKIYYRENSRMYKVDCTVTAEQRIKGLIAIRDCARELIFYQSEDYTEDIIKNTQAKLNKLYDAYTKKFGILNSRGNSMAFSDDSSYSLLCSLEILDGDGQFKSKADMFSKRTIRPAAQIDKAETAVEALTISIAEKACVDLAYMYQLSGIPQEQLIEDLKGIIFHDPEKFNSQGEAIYETADAYLSGNVRRKLAIARQWAEKAPDVYQSNVAALEKVQPKDLDATEIDVRLGTTWLPPDVVKQFLFETLGTPKSYQGQIDVNYSNYTAAWNISGKSADRSGNLTLTKKYGTRRVNAYKLVEDCLNLRNTKVWDNIYVDGEKKRELNVKETAIAQQKQDLIKEAFSDWVWKDINRRERLCALYNEQFNSDRNREYDGSHIKFEGMNAEKNLLPHQYNAVARILYGGNTLLAHCVGAGKTYEMTAAAMESKRLGLCNKSMFVVPKHLVEQWAGEFLNLYPSANILVATKKDFTKKNRKKFFARIATGDYDAIILSYTQFERIPISAARQERLMREQISDITNGIEELKSQNAEKFAVKQLEKTKKTLKAKLKNLLNTGRKDDIVTFEELGIDRLFVDEADYYKNLFLYTKIHGVAGLGTADAQKSSDMFLKCRYLDESTNGRGVIFATGTPISNSITELYTMQRYLQYEALQGRGLQHFDSWASTFGEITTSMELTPEGNGYRLRQRFGRFFNLPELMTMVKHFMDIQTEDMLDLPVPEVEYKNISVPPSQFQRDIILDLGERAEDVRKGNVDPTKDNMLKITNDGRKVALDQRLFDDKLPDNEGSKVNACIDTVYDIWQSGTEEKHTQIIFCDLSTPKTNGDYNVYDDIRQKLIEKGVPPEEVEFIHNAETETQKKALFSNVIEGRVRILLGSTAKLGAGTNVQEKLKAIHDLDCPWRPRDLEQRQGRIKRRGNTNALVYVCRYVTENTFDAYLYQLVESKQKLIGQVMTSKSPVRSIEDLDATALKYAEIKALATGNPHIKEKMDLDLQVSRLQLMRQEFQSDKYAIEEKLSKSIPGERKSIEGKIVSLKKDLATYETYLKTAQPNSDSSSPFCGMVVNGVQYTEKGKAGTAILEAINEAKTTDPHNIGEYMGFSLILSYNGHQKAFFIHLSGALSHATEMSTDAHGNITRLNNTLASLPEKLISCTNRLDELAAEETRLTAQIAEPFAKEDEYQEKLTRLKELNRLLDMDNTEADKVVDSTGEEEPPENEKTEPTHER